MANSLAKVVGDRLKTYRLLNNLRQEDLADMLGVTSQMVSKYETGKNLPNVELFCKLPSLIQCSLDEIVREVKINDNK